MRDHGPGVRDEDLPHIFEPFYRAGARDSKRFATEGTGIGLAITQQSGSAAWWRGVGDQCGRWWARGDDRTAEGRRPSIAGRLREGLQSSS